VEEQLLGRKRFEQDARKIRTLIPQFVLLTSPLTSLAWDGDARSTTAKTVIDLSAVFAVPAGVRAVLVYVYVRDSGAVGSDTWMCLSPNNVAGQGMLFSPMPVADRYGRYSGLIPCDVNGDIYYQIAASAAGCFDAGIEIWGYWL